MRLGSGASNPNAPSREIDGATPQPRSELRPGPAWAPALAAPTMPYPPDRWRSDLMSDAFLDQFLPGAAFMPVRRAIWLANQDAAIALRQPVLFLGEPGVGKTYAAKLSAAHRQWQRQ